MFKFFHTFLYPRWSYKLAFSACMRSTFYKFNTFNTFKVRIKSTEFIETISNGYVHYFLWDQTWLYTKIYLICFA